MESDCRSLYVGERDKQPASPFREDLAVSGKKRKKEKSCEETPGFDAKPLPLPRTGDRLKVGLSSYGFNRMAVRTYEDTETPLRFPSIWLFVM
ncbi:hypothetical protein EYF80_019804 [Liparis tanakae]|uniref:Uncharacterized protein n=1 Tax=Liparis tanakae TaxID=230148 RepID=A0A4Z2HWH1_9TELE|nr:hypothetical protein EYF80_019804 [Liparis tanakae]